MSHFNITAFILLLSLHSVAQINHSSEEEAVGEVMIIDDLSDHKSFRDFDTIQIVSGKSYVFLIDVPEFSSPSVQQFGGSQVDEEKELILNFGENAFEIFKISNHVLISFENGKILDLTDEASSFQAFAYWSGELTDDVEVKEGTRMATEFVASQLGSDKESAYIVRNRKYKEEIALLKKEKNFTENSKKVMNAMLNEFSNPLPDSNAEILMKDVSENLVKVETFMINERRVKSPYKITKMNENGQPLNIKLFVGSGNEPGSINFIYNNEILTEIKNVNERITKISYNDGLMILENNIGDATETIIFWVEKDKILRKSYVLMNDDTYAFQNTYSELKIENDCVVRYINFEKWSTDCNTDENIFPLIQTYTSFQDGEILQFIKSKIVQIDDKTFEKYYSSIDQEREEESFTLQGTFQFNEKNLISSYRYMKDENEKILLVEYTWKP